MSRPQIEMGNVGLNIPMKSQHILTLIQNKVRMFLSKLAFLIDTVVVYVYERFPRKLLVILPLWRTTKWERYSSVWEEIKKLGCPDKHCLTILDVGGADGALGAFLPLSKYQLVVIDIDTQELRKIKSSSVIKVAGSGLCLPFRDDFFDIVTSVDALEHIPRQKREDFCRELKRVTKGKVILSCPVDSFEGVFQGTACDVRLSNWYRQRGKHRIEMKSATWLRSLHRRDEHFQFGLPRVEEFTKLFPDSIIRGRQNCQVWFKQERLASTSFLNVLNGPYYELFLKKLDKSPPYYGCIVTWQKR
jgi:2-polyprenyl-3-methyl-5-hydroxy-6-metoxy-1,4-benzoquinol methylase